MSTTLNKEADVLSRLEVSLSPEGARDLLKIEFSSQDRERMRELPEKANQGTRTPDRTTGTQHYCAERHTEFKFPVHGHVEKAFREFSAAAQGHGVFLCRGGHFASIDMVKTPNLAGQQQQRTELPGVLMNR